MNIGKYIFAQVIDFIPRYQFDKLVKNSCGSVLEFCKYL